MRILERIIYRGPNPYAEFPVILVRVDLGALEEWPSARLGPAFTDGLIAALPGLRDHGCSYRMPGGFVRRLTEDEGTWFGHIFEHVVLELQRLAGSDVSFGKTRSNGEHGHYDVVYEYEDEQVALDATDRAFALLQSLLPVSLRSA